MARHQWTAARRPARWVASAAVLLLFAGSATAAQATSGTALPRASVIAQPGPVKAGQSKIVNSAVTLDPGSAARLHVFVQLAGEGAAQTFDTLSGRGDSVAVARAAALTRRTAVTRSAAAVLAATKSVDPQARELFRVGNVIPGIALSTTPAALRRLADRPDVVQISRLVPKSVATDGGAPLVPAAAGTSPMAGGSAAGQGVRVGIIDSGIDYTHADFGGSGTSGAYQAARRGATWTPTSKVAGGRDFVGDAYNAAAAGSASFPQPDANPVDCSGHGTEVAGAAAGTGLTELSPAGRQWAVAAGTAPGATLYALKVFGCSGTTEAVIPALDWALDPNGDGDFRDRLDIVNLSLTSSGPTVDDPDSAVLNAVAALGVVPVVAAGNLGDNTDAIGSPGTATRALTVAGVTGPFRRLDGLHVDIPGAVTSTVGGQVSAAYPWATATPVSGVVVPLSAADADGCTPLSAADAAAVAGRVAWLTWDDNDATRSCGSAARSAQVRVAGAIGAVLTSGSPTFAAGITGDPGMPVFQLTPEATAALQPAVGAGLRVTFDRSLIGAVDLDDPAVADQITGGSSRGTHGSPFVLKPDVAAAASAQPVAAAGSGTGGTLRSGTSLAAAKVAGVAALVVAAHPRWSAEEIKAAVMNTAGHAVTAGAGGNGPLEGPARVGAGRVDADAASTATVLAYSATTPGAVSLSFGAIQADVSSASVVSTQSLVVHNTGTAAASVALSYEGVVTQPGVAVSVSPAGLSLPPGGSALATVTFAVDPGALRRTMDPTMKVQQTNTVTGLDEPRQFLSDESGRILISGADGRTLRVPVFGAAEPVSNTHAADGVAGADPAVVLTGEGFNQKSDADPESTRYSSLTSVLTLGYERSSDGCSAPADDRCPDGVPEDRISAVGAGRSGPDADSAVGRLWFGLSTAGNFAALGSGVEPTVAIDTTGDRVADYTVQVRTVGGHSDLLHAYLFAGSGPAARLIATAPVNFNSGEVDTNVFDNSVVLIPVDPAALGLTPGATTFPISYSVSTVDPEESLSADGAVDSTGWIPFDVAQPSVQTAAPLWADLGDSGIPYELGATAAARALLLHLQGADGDRQDIVTLSGAAG